MNIKDTNGEFLELRKNSTGNFFNHPILFHPHCQITSRQSKKQPTLFLSEEDWDYIKDPRAEDQFSLGESSPPAATPSPPRPRSLKQGARGCPSAHLLRQMCRQLQVNRAYTAACVTIFSALSSISVNCGYVLYILSKMVCQRRNPNFRMTSSSHLLGPAISFGPGGFNMAYTAGALRVIAKHASSFETALYAGTSTGSIVACLACCGADHEKLESVMQTFNNHFRTMGPTGYHKLISLLGGCLLSSLPDDAHKQCNGRLHVLASQVRCSPTVLTWILLFSMLSGAGVLGYYIAWVLGVILCVIAIIFAMFHATRVKPVVLNYFCSNKQLVSVILQSCSIPLVQDKLPLRRGIDSSWSIDGMFTARHVIFEGMKTILVDYNNAIVPRPDVCPNSRLPSRVVTPPSSDDMTDLLQLGANDFFSYAKAMIDAD